MVGSRNLLPSIHTPGGSPLASYKNLKDGSNSPCLNEEQVAVVKIMRAIKVNNYKEKLLWKKTISKPSLK